MAAILKNTTASLKTWGGIDVSALGSYPLQVVDTLRIMSDELFKTDLTSGEAVINDGFSDLAPMDAVFFLTAYTPNMIVGGTDNTPIGNSGDRLKIDVQFSGDQLIKVSSNDQTSGYLQAKTAGTAGRLVVTVPAEGGNEVLTFDVGANIFDKTIDTTLTALAAYNTNGLMVQTSVGVFVGRSLAAGTGLSIANASGSAGNPSYSISNTSVAAAAYGSSSQVPTFTVNAQGQLTAAANVTIDKLYDHWHGTTQYNASQLRKYTNTGVTDGNGRVTFNLTQNGAGGGTPLFSSILSVNATAIDNSGNPLQVPLASIQSVSATQVVLRFVDGTSTGVLLGGTVNSMQYTGAGYTVYVEITGVK